MERGVEITNCVKSAAAIKTTSNDGAFTTMRTLLNTCVTKQSYLLQIHTKVGIIITGWEIVKMNATRGMGRLSRRTRSRKTFGIMRNSVMERDKRNESVEDGCRKLAKVAPGLRAA